MWGTGFLLVLVVGPAAGDRTLGNVRQTTADIHESDFENGIAEDLEAELDQLLDEYRGRGRSKRWILFKV